MREYREIATNGLLEMCRATNWKVNPDDLDFHLVRGADILFELPEFLYRPILFHFIYTGDVACVEAALRSSWPLRFSPVENENEPSPRRADQQHFTVGGTCYESIPLIHYLCQYDKCSRETAEAVLKILLHRIATNPEDVLDWSEPDRNGRSFLTNAAYHQRLSLFWPIIKHLPFFAQGLKTPFEIPTRVWQWDWEALGEDQKYFNITGAEVLAVPRHTAFLLQYCYERAPRAELVEQHVVVPESEEAGQTSFKLPTGMYQSIFSEFLAGGHVDCAMACLLSPRSIDYTALDGAQRTPLHLLCEYKNFKAEDAAKILDRILERLEEQGKQTEGFSDKIDWGKKDGWGHTFIARAAHYQRLSLFWPIIKKWKVTYFCGVGKKAILPAGTRVWKWDWEALGEAEQACFTLEDGEKAFASSPPESTARLFRICEESRFDPDVELVTQCMKDGAWAGYQDKDSELSVVHELAKRGRAAAVRACLTTFIPKDNGKPAPPLPIDFTSGKIDYVLLGNMGAGLCKEALFLTYLCDYHILPDALEILKAVVERFRQFPNADKMDWDAKLYDGRTFLSAAASAGRLSVFFPVVKCLAYFTGKNAAPKFSVSQPVLRSDWDQLTPEDQERFELEKGIKEDPELSKNE